MAKVYSYVRFSTRKQLEGDSLRRQVEASDEWIRRNGHELADITLHDIGKSGFHARHLRSPDGKLREFLAMIESGRVKAGDILLVENLDRLSRQAMNEARKVFESILDAGVIIAVLRPYERLFTKESISDPFGLMEPLMAFHLAYIESKNKSDRLKAMWDKKRAEAAAKGKSYKFDKRGPSWLSWDKKKKSFVTNEWAEAIKFIFAETAKGNGQRTVLAALQTKFPKKRWNSSFIQKVLADRAVLGIRQPRTLTESGVRVDTGKEIKGYYPAVISQAMWDRVQLVKSKNRRMKGPTAQFVNLFTGIIFDAVDGQPMHIQTTRSKRTNGVNIQRRFVSYGHRSMLANSNSISVAYWELEEMFLSHVNELRPSDLLSNTGVSELRAKTQELGGIDERLNRIEKDLANATDREYEALRASLKLVIAKREKVQRELEKLNVEVNADKPLNEAKRIISLLKQVDGDELHTLRLRLRSLVTELVSSIHVKAEKHYGRVYSIVQITYLDDSIRQFGWGPGWMQHHSPRSKDACELTFNFDLRNQQACKKNRLTKLAKLLAKPIEPPTVKTIPATVGEAVELFIRVRQSQIAKRSFRVVPAKLRKFASFVGNDTPTNKIGLQHWRLFIRLLRIEVREKKIQLSTARVTHNRAREFIRWLIQLGEISEFDYSGSAAAAVKV